MTPTACKQTVTNQLRHAERAAHSSPHLVVVPVYELGSCKPLSLFGARTAGFPVQNDELLHLAARFMPACGRLTTGWREDVVVYKLSRG
uniref:Uncharacterized protein n=1 Tax=Mycena chlorophos TaxID=658473 RepID=A0ABQ0LIG0_MYCCL|nr:predicted protein [Mycena chlorophos]